MWLAVCPYPASARRLRIVNACEGRNTERVRLILPLPAWLRDRLQRNEIAFDATGEREARDYLAVTGLLRVQEGVLWDGPLTKFGPEGSLLHEYFLRPSDAFSLNIVQAFKLVEPRKIFCAQSRLGVPWDITTLLLGSQQCLQFMPLSGSTRTCSFADICGSVGCSLEGVASRIFAWPLVEPISKLALNGQWIELVGMGRWKAVVPELSEDLRNSLQDAGHEALSVPDNLDPERLWYISDQLKDWAAMLLSNPGDQDVADLKGALVGAVKSLEAAALALGAKPQCQGRSLAIRDGHFKHSALLMINSLLLSRLIRDGSHFKEIIKRAVGMAFPALTHQVEQLFHSSALSVPSVSSISRARIALDAALCLMERIEPKQYVVRFGIADSSPQKRDDWLLSSWDEIASEDLVATFRAVCALSSLDSDLSRLRSTASGLAELKALHSTVKKGVRRVFNLPYALGVGGTSLTHKVAAFCSPSESCMALSASLSLSTLSMASAQIWGLSLELPASRWQTPWPFSLRGSNPGLWSLMARAFQKMSSQSFSMGSRPRWMNGGLHVELSQMSWMTRMRLQSERACSWRRTNMWKP